MTPSAAPAPPPATLPPHPDVHAGRRAWLFLTGGTNRVLEQYGRPGIPRRVLWRWRRLLSERVRGCARLGARYVHAVAPEKLTIYPELTDGLAYDPERAPALRLARWLRFSPARGAWVDLTGALRRARDGTPLYLHTDSHWTFAGCETAYRAILAAMGVAPREDLAARRIPETIRFFGDLGDKFEPVRTEDAEGTRFESAARRVHANPFLLHFEALGRAQDAHLGAHAVFRNDDPGVDPRRLVIFGDSYAQHTPRSPTATLTALLADTFAEVHFLWSPSIDWEYLERVRPDFVLGEVAERFMIDVPPAGFRIERLAELALARKADLGADPLVGSSS